jgi:hypothetical protein
MRILGYIKESGSRDVPLQPRAGQPYKSVIKLNQLFKEILEKQGLCSIHNVLLFKTYLSLKQDFSILIQLFNLISYW